MRKLLSVVFVLILALSFAGTPAYAVNTAVHGKMTGKTVVAGLASLIVWPGLGQYLNDNYPA